MLMNLLSDNQQSTNRQPNILIVDDCLSTAELLKEFLYQASYSRVDCVHSITDARKQLLLDNCPAGVWPAVYDIILLDVLLPDGSGLALCESIREQSRFEGSFVIMITGENSLDSLERAFSTGANDYIRKPVHKAELQARVRAAARLWQSEQKLREMAHSDPLTGLPNRALLIDRLENALKLAERNHQHCGLIYVDLDHFKPLNDRFGHRAGDMALKIVSSRLRTCVRSSDTVARVGGDEFVIVLPVVTHIDEAKTVAQKVVDALSAPVLIDDRCHMLGASVGVALSGELCNTSGLLLEQADRAMYASKVAGRSCFTTADTLRS